MGESWAINKPEGHKSTRQANNFIIIIHLVMSRICCQAINLIAPKIKCQIQVLNLNVKMEWESKLIKSTKKVLCRYNVGHDRAELQRTPPNHKLV